MTFARWSVQLLAMGALVAGCASTETASLADRTLQYGCNDLVVIGRLKNEGDYSPLEAKGDILGHGVMTATISVHRVVRGAHVPSRLPVSYAGHTFLRDDRDFMFVLERNRAVYTISTAQLMTARPLLATHCR